MMDDDTYKILFEKQKEIIDRMKKELEALEKILKKLDSREENIKEKNQNHLEDSESGSDLFDSDDDEESYDLNETNMSDNIRLDLGLGTKTDFYNNLSWTPPNKSGLDNSQPLIQ